MVHSVFISYFVIGSLVSRGRRRYDHVGRLKEAYSGREARGLTPTNPADSPFRQSFGYNAFSNMTSRTGRFWRQTQLPESATYTNDRRGSWSYDANGNVLTDNSHENAFDAAGRQTFTQGPWNGCGRSYDIEQQYDGDGRVARRVETYRNEDYVGDPPEMSCNTTGGTTYYVNASALGGLKLIEVNASGAKIKGYVYANGQRLALQAIWTGGHTVSYYHANPGTKSWSETSDDRYAFRREMGPLEEELGTYDPYIMLESPIYSDVHPAPMFIEGGDPFDLGSGCGTIDGLPASCSELQMRLEAGTLEAYYPGRRKRDPNQPDHDPNPPRSVPITLPIGNLGLGVYVILMPTLLNILDSRFASFGSVSFTVPQETAMDIARRKNCATPNSIVEQFKDNFEAQWKRTTESGEENGSLVFYEKDKNTYPLEKLSEGKHLRFGKTQYAAVVPAMPQIGPETDKAISNFRTAGRSVYFLAFFHTHPNFRSGASRSGEPSADDVQYQRGRGNPLGIIRTGEGYSFFSNGKTFKPGDSKANDCIWQINNSRK